MIALWLSVSLGALVHLSGNHGAPSGSGGAHD